MHMMTFRRQAWLTLLAGTLAGLSAWGAGAADAVPVPAAGSTLEQVAARIAGAKASELRATPIKGIYEYQRGAELAYVTEDGRYAFTGDLYQLSGGSAQDNKNKGNVNLTTARRQEVRRNLIAAVPEASMLVFAPKDPKYTVTVFTDVDCQYCRALHRQIADYNKLGIRVRYLSYPRTGPATESWTKAEQVWCAVDRNAALTRAKQGEPTSGAVCASNPVASHYALGKMLQISGTPAIVTQYGEMIEGYASPADLLKELQGEAQLAAR
jgi:thiol:disulfide interchange protein DsbC